MSRPCLAMWTAITLAACQGGGPASVDLAMAPGPPGASDAAPPVDLGAADAIAPGNPYASPGPESYATTTVQATLAGSAYPLTLYVPQAAGPRPVVALLPGFGQPGAAYAAYATRLASFGVIVLLRDDPGFFTASSSVAAELDDEIATWLPAQQAAAGGPLSGRVDLARVGLMGHSRGGQVILLSATTALLGKVKAVFGLDPVDASASGSRARDTLGGLGVPSAFIGETLDGTSALGFGMACAPTADDYAAIYAAAPSPSLLLTAVGAAHFDFEDRGQATGAALCQTGSADPVQVLDMAVTLSTGFFARELLGQPVGAGLDGAGAAGYVQAGRLAREQK